MSVKTLPQRVLLAVHAAPRHGALVEGPGAEVIVLRPRVVHARGERHPHPGARRGERLERGHGAGRSRSGTGCSASTADAQAVARHRRRAALLRPTGKGSGCGGRCRIQLQRAIGGEHRALPGEALEVARCRVDPPQSCHGTFLFRAAARSATPGARRQGGASNKKMSRIRTRYAASSRSRNSRMPSRQSASWVGEDPFGSTATCARRRPAAASIWNALLLTSMRIRSRARASRWMSSSAPRIWPRALVARMKRPGAYTYYMGPGGYIYPTLISETTAPALCATLRSAVERERGNAIAVRDTAIHLLVWHVGARNPIQIKLPGISGLEAFSATEQSIIIEARKILSSAAFARIRAAQAAGRGVNVRINGRLIQYEPGAPCSGMTIFGENGFLLGREAFKSESEVVKTVLHELHRLTTSVVRSQGATMATVHSETQAAKVFADRAFKAVLEGGTR